MKWSLPTILALLLSCSGTPRSEDAQPRPEQTTTLVEEREPTPDASAPLNISGKYVGSYVCPQGQTGLVLMIDEQDGRLEAVFEFGPHPENPDVPEGSFRMRGVVEESGAMRLDASEEDWIEQPEGYMTVDLLGQFGDGEVFGEIVNVECTTFAAVRED